MYPILIALALTTAMPDNLGQIKTDVDAVRLLHTDGVISDSQSQGFENDLLGKASQIEGKPVDYATLDSLTKGVVDQLKSFFTFTRTLTIIAAIIGIVALIALGGHYLVDILSRIPGVGYEAIVYSLSIGAIVLGAHLRPEYALYAIFPGCLGFLGCFALTDNLHKPGLKGDSYSLLCSIIWGGVAVYFQSQAVGFIAIMAVLAAVGMNDLLDPLFKATNDDHVFKVTIASFAILAAYVVSHVSGQDVGKLAAFNTGAEWFGTFGYFLGVLCLASKYYYNNPQTHFYIPMQVVAVVSGIAALYLGNLFGMPYLRGVGGTFFCLYLIEKYMELPWKGIGWAWAALGLAGMLYGLTIFAQSHPQYFLFTK